MITWETFVHLRSRRLCKDLYLFISSQYLATQVGISYILFIFRKCIGYLSQVRRRGAKRSLYSFKCSKETARIRAKPPRICEYYSIPHILRHGPCDRPGHRVIRPFWKAGLWLLHFSRCLVSHWQHSSAISHPKNPWWSHLRLTRGGPGDVKFRAFLLPMTSYGTKSGGADNHIARSCLSSEDRRFSLALLREVAICWWLREQKDSHW